jgi:phage-related minor tail protein
MRVRVRAVTALCLSVALLVAGCAEGASPTAPKQVDGGNTSLLGGLLGGVTSLLIAPVQRSAPLAQDVSWSFTVGSAGGSSSNAASGLTISVPRYAVSRSTTITVTALAGSAVAYRFEPHGLEFNRDVTLTQNLNGTSVGLLSSLLISGAYFATDDLELNPGGLALVTEIIPASIGLLTRKASFPIEHFSGYILASGRGQSREPSGDQ